MCPDINQMIILETILIIIIALYLLGLIARLWFRYYIRRMQNRMNQRQQHYEDRQKPDGHVTIQCPQKDPKNERNHEEGEYVDFEEIRF